MLGHAGEAVDELSKPSPSVETVQGRTKEFLKSVEVGGARYEWAGLSLGLNIFLYVVSIELT